MAEMSRFNVQLDVLPHNQSAGEDREAPLRLVC